MEGTLEDKGREDRREGLSISPRQQVGISEGKQQQPGGEPSVQRVNPWEAGGAPGLRS